MSAEDEQPGPSGPQRERAGTTARETTSLAIGIAVGLGLGLLTDDVGLWLPVGVALGITGAFASRRRSGGGTEDDGS
jgi:hypothetical protein